MENNIRIVLEKIEKLIDLNKCYDDNYQREEINKKLREEIFNEQKGLCFLCKCKTTIPLTHHIQPDGKSVKENLVMICPLCHQWIHWMLKKYLGYRGTTMRFNKW